MEKINRKIHKIITFLAYRRHSIVLIISIIGLLLIFFNLIKFDVMLGFSENLILETFYQILVISAMIFVVLFLPSYPLFFIIFKKQKFNFLEKLGLTFVCNLSFYILVGYFGFLIGFLLTGFFFFITLLIAFFSIIGYILFIELKNGKYDLLKKNKNFEKIQGFRVNFSLFNFLKKKICSPLFLLIVFIILICLYSFIRFDFFYGTDPWYHLYITKLITENHFLAFSEYHGAMGIHIFGATINFFSSIELILIPRYFVFYTFPITGLILYNIFVKIFKNSNLAIFGVFFLESGLLGFYGTLLLYWPTSLAIILCLEIFFLLYNRLKNFIGYEKPLKKDIFSNLIFTYILIIPFFISSLITHSLNTLFFLISFFWVFLIYFIKNIWRGFDFLLICLLTGIFLIFFNLNLSVGHIRAILSELSIEPWYYIIFPLIFSLMGGIVLIWWIKSKINFIKANLKSLYYIKKEKNPIAIKKKSLIIIISVILTFHTLFFLTGILFWFNYENLTALFPIPIIVITSCALYGMYLFRKKPRGMVIAIWGISFGIILLVALIAEVFIQRFEFLLRIFDLSSVFLTIGLLSYIFLTLIKNSIRKLKIKIFLLSLVVFSLFLNFSYLFEQKDHLSINRLEWTLLRYQMKYTSDNNVIITEFGWGPIFLFYEFPYEENNRSLIDVNFDIFVLAVEENIFAKNHILENGTNILKQLKKKYNTDVFLIIPEFFPIFRGFEFNVHLTTQDYEAYYNLNYVNRIISSKSDNGIDKPCYWVI